MEILLRQWSSAIQWISVMMMVVFFALLARALRRRELRWCVAAWTANLAALTVTYYYWFLQPGEAPGQVVAILYMASKTAFAVLLIYGAWHLKRPGSRLPPLTHTLGAVAVFAVAASFTRNLNAVGILQQGMLGALFAGAAPLLLRPPRAEGDGWLAAGFAVRGILGGVEAAVYAIAISAPEAAPALLIAAADAFLSTHSFIDTGAEWLLTLTVVLAVSGHVRAELHATNRELRAAQEDLRRLADRDPLTALANRRSLPEIFRAAQPRGALLLFFDLDGFKKINDRHGHRAGDACLKRFAIALGECFRPGDALVRYAGDEFLVVAAGLDRPSADERVARLRRDLAATADGTPGLTFSVGFGQLAPGGQPEAALEAADASMYRAKSGRAGV